MLKLTDSFVLVDLEALDSASVIQEMASRLHQGGIVDENYGAATIAREAVHPTGLPTRPFPIAFPHADAEGVNESALAVAILTKPVSFKNMGDPDEELPVEIVIMMATKSPEEQVDTLRKLADLFGEAEKLAELKEISSPREITEWLTLELNLDH